MDFQAGYVRDLDGNDAHPLEMNVSLDRTPPLLTDFGPSRLRPGDMFILEFNETVTVRGCTGSLLFTNADYVALDDAEIEAGIKEDQANLRAEGVTISPEKDLLRKGKTSDGVDVVSEPAGRLRNSIAHSLLLFTDRRWQGLRQD